MFNVQNAGDSIRYSVSHWEIVYIAIQHWLNTVKSKCFEFTTKFANNNSNILFHSNL